MIFKMIRRILIQEEKKKNVDFGIFGAHSYMVLTF